MKKTKKIKKNASLSAKYKEYNKHFPKLEERREASRRMASDLLTKASVAAKYVAAWCGVPVKVLYNYSLGVRIPKSRVFYNLLDLWSTIYDNSHNEDTDQETNKDQEPDNASNPACTDTAVQTESVVQTEEAPVDMVNHPPHYAVAGITTRPIECIDVARHLPYSLGCAFKYVWRAGLKGGVDAAKMDIDKAVFYIDDWYTASMAECRPFEKAELVFKLIVFPDSAIWVEKAKILAKIVKNEHIEELYDDLDSLRYRL